MIDTRPGRWHKTLAWLAGFLGGMVLLLAVTGKLWAVATALLVIVFLGGFAILAGVIEIVHAVT